LQALTGAGLALSAAGDAFAVFLAAAGVGAIFAAAAARRGGGGLVAGAADAVVGWQ
jgi:hypothetical protein